MDTASSVAGGFDLTPEKRDSNNLVVKKLADAVNICNLMTLAQRRIWNLLLWWAYPTLRSAEIYVIDVKTLQHFFGYTGNNRDWLRTAALDLMTLSVEWGVVDSKSTWTGSTALASVRIVNNTRIEYSFSPHLRERLYEPEIYSLLNLAVQTSFSTKYSLVLWEHLAGRLGESAACVVTRTVDEMRKLQGISASEYTDYRDLAKRVLKPALDEVSNKSDLMVEATPVKNGRKIVAIEYRVQRKPAAGATLGEGKTGELGEIGERRVRLDKYFDLGKIEQKAPSPSSQVDAAFICGEAPDATGVSIWAQRLVHEFGVSERDAAAIVERIKDVEYLEYMLDDIIAKYNRGEIKTLAGYTFKTLIKCAETRPHNMARTPLQSSTPKRLKGEAGPITEHPMRESYTQERRKKAEEILQNIDEGGLKKIHTEWGSRCLIGPIKKHYEESGLEHSMVRASILEFVASRYIEDRYLVEFDAYLEHLAQKLKINH